MPLRQVDISKKEVVYREATATGRICLKRETIDLIRKGKLEKGDPISLAAAAAVLATKLTPNIVVLAHPLKIERTQPQIVIGRDWVDVTVKVAAHEKTGVEMEALTAVAVALLNIWDVVKSHEKDSEGQYPTTCIQSIRVTKKVKKATETA
jgi:cyclic pyranopterin monophosphate synthase